MKLVRLALPMVAVLGSALRAPATADYGPAVDRLITGCTKWYTSGYGHKFCVVHSMEGYYLTGTAYLRRCDISASCHYTVNGLTDYSGDAAPGEISQLVREAYYAWHATCWNQHSLGVEHEGFVSNPAWFTEAMYQASALLFRHFCDKFDIPKDRNHIVGHDQKRISGWPAWASANLGIDPYCNSHTDPGLYWNWSHYMDLIIGGTDNAAFVAKTVADGATFAPGQTFACTFVMNNNGTTTWIANGGDGYTFNNNGGTAMGAPFATPLAANVAPGGNASFTINFTAPATPGSYTVQFRMNSASFVYFGQQVSLTINVADPAPTITTQPASQTQNPGQTATFTVVASGATGYQWKKNGVNLANGGRISGATSATLTITDVQLSDAAFYTVVASNSGGSTTSQAAQLAVAATAAPVGTGTGLRAHYFDHTDFSALKLSRVDATVNFDWGTGSPGGGVDAETFSVRWLGQVEPRYSQTYTFYTTTDDGVRLWVNGVQLVNKWVNQGATEWSGSLALTAGQKYDLVLEYYENTSVATAKLSWSSASQLKEVIPATQLYRPPPVLAAIANQTIAEGLPLTVLVTTTSWDEVAGVTAFEDFESYPDGSASDIIMFRKPHNSGTTIGFLDSSVTNYTATTASFPAGHGGTRVLKAYWSFLTGTSNPWLRLTTANAANRPNPIIYVTRSLWFDLHADKAVKVGLGVRETNPTGGIGEDGGTSGPIEFCGTPGKNGSSPNPSRSVPANTWTTLKFNLPLDPVSAFTGNGILESTTSKGVFEHLAIVPQGGMGVYNVFLDNFAVIQNTALTYSLEPGAPAGATIDAQTGAFSWTPAPGQGPASYNVTVRVTDGGASPRNATQTFTVTVNAPPVITAQPASHTVSPGANVTFTVTATGTAPLHYQWRHDGADIAGATDASYAILNVESSDAGDYFVVVTNALGSTISSNGTLVVSLESSPPTITTQPAGQTVNQNANATFTVGVVGTTPLFYQWRFNDEDIAGATNTSYTRLNAQPAHAGNYSVLITNAYGAVLSSNAWLAVNVPPVITTPPQSQTVNQGSNVTFTVVATGTPPLSYQWRKAGTNIAGATDSTFTWHNVQADDAANYTVVVANMAGSITSAVATLTVNLPPSITAQPASQEVNAGANVTLTVTATGTAPLAYQWRKNGAPIAGATGSGYTKNNVQAADVGAYSVIVSNFLGTVTSTDALLGLNAVIVFSDDVESGNLNQWTVVSGATTLDNAATQNHTSGGSRSAYLNITTDKMYHNLPFELEGRVRLTYWGYDTTSGSNNGGQTRWFGELRGYGGAGYGDGGVQQVFALGRYGVGFGTGTGSLASEVVNTTNYHGRVVSGANAGWFNTTVQRSVGWHKFEIERAANGTTIYFYVDGNLARTITDATYYTLDSVTIGSIASGSTSADAWFDDVKVEYFDPPTITSQPVAQTASVGGSATFSVVATNTALTYQWRREGVSVAGATTRTLTLNNIQGADAGSYTVVVGNGAGVVVSTGAALLVPPAITTPPASRTNLAGTTATFSVVAAGQGPLSYRWKKNGVDLDDGGNVSGARTDTLVLASVSPSDVADYVVAVTNAAGGLVSAPASLVVHAPPVILTHPVSQAVAAGANVVFTSTAAGTAPLHFQWQFNGSDLAGATETTLELPGVATSHSGSYTLTVSNPAGFAVSDPAMLLVNTAPTLALVPDRVIHAGTTVVVTNAASDPETPEQTLNFSLDAAPAGASLDPASGVFAWSSTIADEGTTNWVTVRVTDNGTPSLSDAKSFSISVRSPPVIVSAAVSNNLLTLTWTSIPGQSYRVQFKDHLDEAEWNDLLDVAATDTTASALDGMANDEGIRPQRFYRVLVVP